MLYKLRLPLHLQPLRQPQHKQHTRTGMIELWDYETGVNKYVNTAAEIDKNPVCEHQIRPEYRYEQADTGRDYRNRFARPNSQARTGIGKYYFSCSTDHDQHWQANVTRLILTLLATCDDHTKLCQKLVPKKTWEHDSPMYPRKQQRLSGFSERWENAATRISPFRRTPYDQHMIV